MKKLSIFIAAFALVALAGAKIVYAAGTLQQANANLSNVATRAGTTQGSLENVTGQVINGALTLVGIIFLALMVWAGYLWMTARGEEGPIDKAKTIIQSAIIGLVIVMSAYAITVFVANRFSSASSGTIGDNGGCCVMQVSTGERSGAWLTGNAPSGWCTSGQGSCVGGVTCSIDSSLTTQLMCESLH